MRDKRKARFGGWLGRSSRIVWMPTFKQAEQLREMSRESRVNLHTLRSMCDRPGFQMAWPEDWPTVAP